MGAKAIVSRIRLGANPIIVKELRSRMRGVRAFAVLTSALLFLAGVSYILYRVVLSATRYSNMPVSPQIGQTLLIGLVLVELMMVCFVTPAVTAGSISGEQEKLTYEMLLATPLRPASILWGKLISALSYVLLLIFAAVPMASLVFVFGGVAAKDVVKGLVILAATTVTLGVAGVFMSALMGRTVRATVATYLFVLGLLVGPLMVYVLVGVMRQREPPGWILVPNPVSALFSAFSPAQPYGGPIGILNQLGMLLSGNLSRMRGGMVVTGIPRPLYHYTLSLYGILSAVLYLLTTRLVRPARRWHIRWKEVILALAVFLALGALVGVPFALTSNRYERIKVAATPTPAPFFPPPPVVVEREIAVPVTQVVEPQPTATPVPTPSDGSGGSIPLSDKDRAAIYAAVIRQVYLVDHTFDQAPGFPTVYLPRQTETRSRDPNVQESEPQLLPDSMQATISDALADLPAEFIWVDDRSEVPLESKGERVKDGGAIISVGNIHFNDDNQAVVTGEIYLANLGAGGKTYLLEQVDGVWQVVGDTGVQWMS